MEVSRDLDKDPPLRWFRRGASNESPSERLFPHTLHHECKEGSRGCETSSIFSFNTIKALIYFWERKGCHDDSLRWYSWSQVKHADGHHSRQEGLERFSFVFKPSTSWSHNENQFVKVGSTKDETWVKEATIKIMTVEVPSVGTEIFCSSSALTSNACICRTIEILGVVWPRRKRRPWDKSREEATSKDKKTTRCSELWG